MTRKRQPWSLGTSEQPRFTAGRAARDGKPLAVLLTASIFLLSPPILAQPNECPTPINGALQGEPGNIQDHMFHSLAIDPTNPNVVYAGTETNGIFKTTDSGNSWRRLRLGLKCTANKTGYSQIFDIVPDPVNPQVIYAATVNGPGPADNPAFPSASAGVYKSTNGGETWAQKVQGLPNTYATYVLIDSTHPSRVYAGIGGLKSTFSGSTASFYQGGIYASDDGGDTWSLLPLPSGVETNIFVDMVLRGSQQRTIYASTQIHGGDASLAYGLIRSRDAGQSWVIVNPPGQTISGFDVFRADPNIIYGHDLSPARRVHKSTDGGDTWKMLNAGFYGVVRIHPTDSQTVYYTGRTSIMKSTDGFLTTRTVYQDTTLTDLQQMTDIKISPSNPNVVWAAAKGYYLYRSTDGGETFTKISAIRDLVYGNPLSQVVPAIVNDGTDQTGVAFANTGSAAIELSITVENDSGTASTESPFPVLRTVEPGQQISFLTSMLFPASGGRRWMRVTANRTGLAGFFLSFDSNLATMDGAGFSTRPVQDFILPETQDAAIALVVPGGAEAEAVIQWISDAGMELAREILRIPAGGRYTARVRDLFPGHAGNAGYLRVTSSEGLVSLEEFGRNALRGLETDEGRRQLFSPQYVLGGMYTSVVTLLNLEDDTATVNLTWFSNGGAVLGHSATVVLPPRGRALVSDPAVFGVPVADSIVEGYLRVNSDRLIAGVVRFGDFAEDQFQTTLPLVARGQTEALYAHVAEDATYLTGVAVINNNSQPANVDVAVFNSSGLRVGGGSRVIAANAKISEVLRQIDPTLGPMSSGYFKVVSDRPVLGFAIFGTHTLSVLSAIPPQ